MRWSAGHRAAVIGVLLASIALALAGVALVLPLSSQATAKSPKTPKPPKLKPPHAATERAVHAGETTAELDGTVNPHGMETSCYFQYGTTTAYGAQTPSAVAGSGTTGVKVSQAISGLQGGTIYHFRIVATSSAGTSDGVDRTFTTKRIPLKFVIVKASKASTFGSPFSLTGTLSGAGGAGHQVILQDSTFPYLTGFSDVGTPVSTNAAGSFTLTVPNLTQTTELRVRTLDAPPIYSQIVKVKIAVLVTLNARPAGKTGYVRLSGTVAPAEVGTPVELQWVKPTGKPVTVGSTVVRRGTTHTSRFSAVVRIRHSGYYRALVRVSNGKQVSGSSRTVMLRAAPVVHKKHRVHAHRH
ncbi:MAG TPA: hypothetical protein VG147_17240 [Solirubrobacteraceae bacterium]|nr:hypothetical protein [Solirubrobacteraceae bacterium]